MRINDPIPVAHEVFVETSLGRQLANAIALARVENHDRWSEVRDVAVRDSGEMGRGVVFTIGLKASARRSTKVVSQVIEAAIAKLSERDRAALAQDEETSGRSAIDDAAAGM